MKRFALILGLSVLLNAVAFSQQSAPADESVKILSADWEAMLVTQNHISTEVRELIARVGVLEAENEKLKKDLAEAKKLPEKK